MTIIKEYDKEPRDRKRCTGCQKVRLTTRVLTDRLTLNFLCNDCLSAEVTGK